jgi:UDP-N-acetylmuramoylalanine--D-glutamate ligase
MVAADPDLARAVLVVGFGVTGAAMARAVRTRGGDVRAVDDHPSDASRRRADLEAVDLLEAPRPEQWRDLVADRSAVLPAPGLPDHHPVFAAARDAGVPILSEFDLAGLWDGRPVLAITGTNGKTTVTTLVTDMFEASGRRAAAVGNLEVPLVAAIEDPTTEVFVVEASSFRLGHTRTFRPAVATWLNFAPDHLDVHATLAGYEQAKARIWRDLGPDGVAIANADDPVVMRNTDPGVRTRTFGLGGPGRADYTVDGPRLVGPGGDPIADIDDLFRSLPHDLSNALAASATALEGGATPEGVRAALSRFRGLAHRVELVAEHAGIRWFDDSKATAPHATLAAVSGFDSVVLVAGGRNKGIDLSPLADGAAHIRSVVAIGDAADEVVAAFAGVRPVTVATSMADAVARAAEAARPGDAVVLSPGCASFDWYGSYAERGDDFARRVREHLGDAHRAPELEEGTP